jgi:hypothetical protein
MRVTLSPLEFDPLGSVTLDAMPDQTMGETRRRMNRIATLDGGAVFNDFGFSEADRTISLRWKVRSRAQEGAVERLVQLYARVHVATPQGFYLAGLEVYVPGAQESGLVLLVVEKLA